MLAIVMMVVVENKLMMNVVVVMVLKIMTVMTMTMMMVMMMTTGYECFRAYLLFVQVPFNIPYMSSGSTRIPRNATEKISFVIAMISASQLAFTFASIKKIGN